MKRKGKFDSYNVLKRKEMNQNIMLNLRRLNKLIAKNKKKRNK